MVTSASTMLHVQHRVHQGHTNPFNTSGPLRAAFRVLVASTALAKPRVRIPTFVPRVTTARKDKWFQTLLDSFALKVIDARQESRVQSRVPTVNIKTDLGSRNARRVVPAHTARLVISALEPTSPSFVPALLATTARRAQAPPSHSLVPLEPTATRRA